MPRRGPRPYECVRRAWHSDRHQPMRGSLIQEIFRITTETHSPSTKKKEEWQEKLPIVVLKAEEIIYSKANSEADYMDPTTLLERVKDAIDTIIRRDQSIETGMFLQPCIEAALNLGCVARRASRSQRDTDARFYLGTYSLRTSSRKFPNCVKSMNEEGTTMPTSPSPIVFQYPNLLKPTNSIYQEKGPINGEFCVPNRSYFSNTFSTYPLYYGFCPPPKPGSDSDKERVDMDMTDIELSSARMEFSKKDDQPINNLLGGQPELVVCDLALRLALLSVSACTRHYWPGETDGKGGAGPNLPQEINTKFGDLALLKKHREFPLSSWKDLENSPSDPPSGIRKRRAAETAEGNDNFLWKSKLLCSSLSTRGAKG